MGNIKAGKVIKMFKKGLHSCNGVRMNDFKNEDSKIYSMSFNKYQ